MIYVFIKLGYHSKENVVTTYNVNYTILKIFVDLFGDHISQVELRYAFYFTKYLIFHSLLHNKWKTELL